MDVKTQPETNLWVRLGHAQRPHIVTLLRAYLALPWQHVAERLLSCGRYPVDAAPSPAVSGEICGLSDSSMQVLGQVDGLGSAVQCLLSEWKHQRLQRRCNRWWLWAFQVLSSRITIFRWLRNSLRRKRGASTLLRHTTLSNRVIERMFAAEIWLAFNQDIEVLIELLSVLLKHGLYIWNSSLFAPSWSQPDPYCSKSVHQGLSWE